MDKGLNKVILTLTRKFVVKDLMSVTSAEKCLKKINLRCIFSKSTQIPCCRCSSGIVKMKTTNQICPSLVRYQEETTTISCTEPFLPVGKSFTWIHQFKLLAFRVRFQMARTLKWKFTIFSSTNYHQSKKCIIA